MTLSHSYIVNVIEKTFNPTPRIHHRHTGMRYVDEWTIELDCVKCGKTVQSHFIEGDEDRPDRWTRFSNCEVPDSPTKGNAA